MLNQNETMYWLRKAKRQHMSGKQKFDIIDGMYNQLGIFQSTHTDDDVILIIACVATTLHIIPDSLRDFASSTRKLLKDRSVEDFTYPAILNSAAYKMLHESDSVLDEIARSYVYAVKHARTIENAKD